jgi:O-antigen ligase
MELLAPALACLFTVLAWLAFRAAGLTGLVLLAGGVASVIIALVLLFRFPFMICMIWFLSMSGLQAVGMIRMPGLPDLSLTRTAMILVLLAVAIALISGRRLFSPPHGPLLLLILHGVYVLLNMYFFGMESRFHTWLSSSFAPILGYLFARNFVLEDRHLRVLMYTLLMISVYFWVTCVGEKFNIEAIVWPRAIMDRDLGISWFGRSRGPFLQPGITGQFLGWCMMAQVFLLTRRYAAPAKALLVLNIAMSGIGLFLTYTRGSWLATALGLLVMAAFRPQFRKYIAVAVVAGGILVASNALRPTDDAFLGERLGNTSTIENRLGSLAAAVRMVRDHPLFGVGYFRYLDELPEYNQGTNIPLYGYVARGAGKAVPIHDMFIGRASEEGMVSVALVVWLMFVLGFAFWTRWRTSPGESWFDRDFLALYAGIMTSYFVNGATLDYRYFDFVNVLPMFMSGIIIGFPDMHNKVRSVENSLRARPANAMGRHVGA